MHEKKRAVLLRACLEAVEVVVEIDPWILSKEQFDGVVQTDERGGEWASGEQVVVRSDEAVEDQGPAHSPLFHAAFV